MTEAKYYTYRNLHSGGFSTKHHGKVIFRSTNPVKIDNGIFRVSALGNKRARFNKSRNVHAFIVSSQLPKECFNVPGDDSKSLVQVRYNPFKHDRFMLVDDELHFAEEIYLYDGKCYVNEKKKIDTYV